MTTTPTDQTFWARIPSVEDTAGAVTTAPAAGKDTRGLRTRISATASRRSTFKAVGVLGGALALNVLSWLPPSLQRPARAAVGSEYADHCAGYDNWGGYDNNSAACVGAPFSRDYCGGDGWFLQYSGTCFASGPAVACGDGYSKRNAWRWTHAGTRYRCADGVQQWCGGSGFYICAWPNP